MKQQNRELKRFNQALLDTQGRPVTLPAEGIVLSTALAERLGVGIGDRITT